MVETAVVEYHVHHHFEPFAVGFVGQPAVFLVGAEARVNLVVVRCGIPVVGAVAAVVGAVVFEHRRKPQRGYSELLEVVEVLAYAFQVAAVAQAGLRAVVLVGHHAFNLVVVSLARCKPVGHKHVEHVGVGESHVLVAALVAPLQLVLHFLPREIERHLSGLRAAEVEVNEQVVGRVEPHDAVYPHPGIVGLYLGFAYVLAVNHKLQRRVFHPHIPVGGVDSVDFQCCVHSHCCC